MVKIQVTIDLKPGVHDPQAEAVTHALKDMGHQYLAAMTMGKQMVLDIDMSDHDQALEAAHEMCRSLLANTVLEKYELKVIS